MDFTQEFMQIRVLTQKAIKIAENLYKELSDLFKDIEYSVGESFTLRVPSKHVYGLELSISCAPMIDAKSFKNLILETAIIMDGEIDDNSIEHCTDYKKLVYKIVAFLNLRKYKENQMLKEVSKSDAMRQIKIFRAIEMADRLYEALVRTFKDIRIKHSVHNSYTITIYSKHVDGLALVISLVAALEDEIDESRIFKLIIKMNGEKDYASMRWINTILLEAIGEFLSMKSYEFYDEDNLSNISCLYN